jgi:hypothetical protein
MKMTEPPFNNIIEGLVVALDLVSILVAAFLLYTIVRKLWESRSIEEGKRIRSTSGPSSPGDFC